MKRKLIFLAFILISAFANAQYPLLQYLGSDSTIVKSRGGLQGRFAPIPFTDTAAANLSRISQYPGALIYTSGVDKYWYRNATTTGWIEFTSSGGSTVNIYNSNGTLTGERTVDGDGNGLSFNSFRWFAVGADSIQLSLNSDVFRIFGIPETQDTSTYKPLVLDPITGRVLQSSYWYGSGGSGVNIYNSNGTISEDRYVDGGEHRLQFNALQSFQVAADSITFNLVENYLFLTGLVSTQDTSIYKPMVVDPVTGRVLQSSYWYGSGGSGVNIYNSNGTLTSDRNLDGTGFSLGFQTLSKFWTQSDTVDIELLSTGAKVFNIHNLTETQDTTTYKPIVVDPITGRVLQSSYWYGGGDSSIFATVYRTDTLAQNIRDEIAAIPAPTLQQVFAIESNDPVMGGNFKVDVNGYDIDFDNAINGFITVQSYFSMVGGDSLNMQSNQENRILLKNDSIFIKPLLGNLNIDSLNSGSSSDSVLVWDQSTGMVKKRNAADFGGGGSGTVTSVGTGYGLSGGTITTTGTILVDSASLSNYYLRRKDSLASSNLLGYVTKTVLADTAAALRAAISSGTPDTSVFIVDTLYNRIATTINADSLRLKSLRIRNGTTTITPTVTDSTLSFDVTGTTYKIGTYNSQTINGDGASIVADSIYMQEFSAESPGLVPAGGSGTTYLRGDGTWQTVSGGTTGVKSIAIVGDSAYLVNDSNTLTGTKVYGYYNGTKGWKESKKMTFVIPYNGEVVMISGDSLTNGRKVDSIYRTVGKDSIIFNIAGVRYAIKDSTGGGGGTPGGSTTQVQYNNAGSFAGSSNMTFDGTQLYLPSSTTQSGLKVGGLEMQHFATNNNWLSDNIYFNGGFKARVTGYTSMIYFNGGNIEFQTKSTTTTAGSAASPVTTFLLNKNGRIAMGLGASSITPSAYLHLTNGSASASSAPLKFYLSGASVMGTPEAGAVEAVVDTLYYTGNDAVRTQLARTLYKSATLDFSSTGAQSSSDLTITVTGAADGDVVSIGVPNVAVNADTFFSAWVSASNTVTVRFNNYSGGAIDPASGTFKVRVFK